MGLLDELATYDPGYEYGGLLPFRINKKTRQKELAAPAIVKDVARAISAPMRAYEGKIDTSSPEAVMEAANIAGLLGEGAVAATGLSRIPAGQVNHTVWHGSPHKFDKFDMSKIGTGEGAQAYGHGLYFAEAPEVAKEYLKVDPNVLLPPRRLFKGQELEPGTPEYHAATLLDNSGLKSTIREVQGWIDELANVPERAKDVAGYQRTLDTLKQASSKSDFKITKNVPNLYKVDIPDEILPRMLDWDKPLSEQHPDVQAAWKSYLQTKQAKSADKSLSGDLISGGSQFNNPLGKDIHGAIYEGFASKNGGELPKVQEFLRKQGIPGIRYLDGNSRGRAGGELIGIEKTPKGFVSKIRKIPAGSVGDVIPPANTFTTSMPFKTEQEAKAWAAQQINSGSYNYVIFDDTLPKILERNGQPLGLLE